MTKAPTKRSRRSREPRRPAPRAHERVPLLQGEAAVKASPDAAPAATVSSDELGPERLAFLEAECEREYWQTAADALRHVVDLCMRAHFRKEQRRAVARVRSLLKRERERLARRNAAADGRLASRRVIEQIEEGNDPLLKTGLRLLRALEARDTATVNEMTRWRAPEPPARRRMA